MPQLEMTCSDVLEFLKLTQAHEIEIWIDGGWSVDALLEFGFSSVKPYMKARG